MLILRRGDLHCDHYDVCTAGNKMCALHCTFEGTQTNTSQSFPRLQPSPQILFPASPFTYLSISSQSGLLLLRPSAEHSYSCLKRPFASSMQNAGTESIIFDNYYFASCHACQRKEMIRCHPTSLVEVRSDRCSPVSAGASTQ